MPPRDRRQRRRRAAVVGGAAYAAGKHNAANQAAESAPPPAYAEPPPEQVAPSAQGASAGLSPEALEQLRELGQLHEQGVLTDEEFAGEKAKLLAG